MGEVDFAAHQVYFRLRAIQAYRLFQVYQCHICMVQVFFYSGTSHIKHGILGRRQLPALEFIARASDSYIGIPLKNLHIRKNALIAVIARQGKVIVPFGDDKIEEGDHVVIIVCENGIGDLNEVISK